MSDLVAVTVKGLRAGVTSDHVRQLFSEHGFVEDVTIAAEEESSDTFVATVRFRTRTASESAIAATAFFRAAPTHDYAGTPHGGLIVSRVESTAPPSELPPASSAMVPSDVMPHMPPAVPPPPPQPQPMQPYADYGYPPQGYPPAAYGGYPMYGGQQYYGQMAAQPPPAKPAAPQVVTGIETKLFVGGLPYETNEDVVRALFAPYGNILDVHVMNPSSTTNQRCAFVTCAAHRFPPR